MEDPVLLAVGIFLTVQIKALRETMEPVADRITEPDADAINEAIVKEYR